MEARKDLEWNLIQQPAGMIMEKRWDRNGRNGEGYRRNPEYKGPRHETIPSMNRWAYFHDYRKPSIYI